MCDPELMRGAAAPLVMFVVLAGCGGSVKPTPVTGCRGLPTASKSSSFWVLFGSSRRVAQRRVCARFGAPRRIARRGAGMVDWIYRKGVVTFSGQRVVSFTTYDSKGTNTYSVGERLQVLN